MMADLRLGKLPERTPVKVTIAIPPALNEALSDYAALYARTYGNDEPVAELIPAMLAAFLDGDKAFIRWRREVGGRRG
jgi:hypothetical protein